MNRLPRRTVLLTLIHVGGPQPTLDVQWTRQFVRVYAPKPHCFSEIWRKVQVKMPNRKGVVAVRTTHWKRLKWLDEPLETWKAGMLRLGYREVERHG